ncbi:MAG TPA: hypothetical protein VF662_11965 [Allosphingosinicella sp.]|jgi:predicted permease
MSSKFALATRIAFAASLSAALVSGTAAQAQFEKLAKGAVVTYTLSSDPSVRKVGTIAEVDRSQPSAVWYTILTKDMYCGKDRDVVRSDFIISVGGSLACSPAGGEAAASSGSSDETGAPAAPAAESAKKKSPLGKLPKPW